MAIRSLPEFPRNYLSAIPQQLVPANWSLVQIDEYLFGLQIFLESPGPEFAAKAGLFVAAPRSFHIRRLHVIHPDNSSAHGFHDAKCFKNITGPDSARQSVRRVVRDANRVRFIFERNHRSNRAENLFARNTCVVVDVIKNSGFNVVALPESLRAAATDGGLRFFLPKIQVRADAIELFLAHQWPHLRIAIHWRAKLDALGFLGHRLHKF